MGSGAAKNAPPKTTVGMSERLPGQGVGVQRSRGRAAGTLRAKVASMSALSGQHRSDPAHARHLESSRVFPESAEHELVVKLRRLGVESSRIEAVGGAAEDTFKNIPTLRLFCPHSWSAWMSSWPTGESDSQ